MLDLYYIYESIDNDYYFKMITFLLENNSYNKELNKHYYNLYKNKDYQSLVMGYTHIDYKRYFTKKNIDKINEIFLKKFIIERNKKWIPKIISFIKKDTNLIIIGIQHLGSKEGIIELLKKNGFTVEPILD